jgi:CRISPR-associated protein Cmr6
VRVALRGLGVPDCLGLAYDAWAPVQRDGKVPDKERPDWLGELARLPISPDYRSVFHRWRASFARSGDRTLEIELVSRLLVGHGNSTATGVGLTTQHTWGVPIIPGTALKGLLAHHVDAVYGPDDPVPAPWDRPDDERERARYQGVTWDDRGRRVVRGPGDAYRALFGAPEADHDGVCREHGIDAGTIRGAVVFHDATYVPGSANGDRPFAVDVLTVHQKSYYDNAGSVWPNDYDDPNPVGFLTVRPKVRFLLALSGPAEWTARAERLLLDVLGDWGVGAKTSSGYGRLVRYAPDSERAAGAARPGEDSAVAGPRYPRGARMVVTRVEDPKGRGRTQFQAQDGYAGHFIGEQPPSIEVGQTADVWVANVSGNGYTLTLKPPKDRKR